MAKKIILELPDKAWWWSVIGCLDGKKTYAIAIAGAVMGVWQQTGHTVPPWLWPILAALGLGAIRHAIAKGGQQ
jgi:hypothetical protein